MKLGQKTVESILGDWRTAPDPKLKATLGFLEKLTLQPATVTPQDARAVLEAGVSRAALEDAIVVCGLFNIIDRLADAFDFHIPDARGFAIGAKMILRFGYKL